MLRLPDQDFEHAVLGPLGEYEIAAEHLVGGLQLAVDAPVALIEPARVPGQVEMEQVAAMTLKIESLTCSVRRNQDA